MVELITVIILLSVLGVVALSRFGDTADYEASAFYDDVVNALRYAQKLAVGTGCEVQVSFGNTGYSLHQRQTDCTTGAFTLSVVNPVSRNLPYQNTYAGAAIAPSPLTFQFTPDSEVNNLTGDQLITVAGRQLTIYQMTGLVDAQ